MIKNAKTPQVRFINRICLEQICANAAWSQSSIAEVCSSDAVARIWGIILHPHDTAATGVPNKPIRLIVGLLILNTTPGYSTTTITWRKGEGQTRIEATQSHTVAQKKLPHTVCLNAIKDIFCCISEYSGNYKTIKTRSIHCTNFKCTASLGEKAPNNLSMAARHR